MKTIFTSLILSALPIFSILTYSQVWKIQHPCPTPDSRDLFFINDSTGWVVGHYGKVLKTINSGLQWSSQNIGSVYDLNGVYFINNTTGWVVGYDGLFKTTDGGENWAKISNSPSLSNVLFFDKDYGIVSSYNGNIFITKDGGNTWSDFSLANQDLLMEMSFPTRKDGWIAAITNHGGSGWGGKIYHSSDSGKTWQIQIEFNDMMITDFVTSVQFLDTLKGWFAMGSMDKYRKKVYHTNDGGKTWLPQSNVDDGLGRFWSLEDIYMIDTLNGWAAGNEQPVVYYTNNGGVAWHQHGIPGTIFSSIYFSSLNKGWAAGKDNICFTIDSSNTWNTYPYAGNINGVFFKNSSYGYAVGAKGYVLKTVDGGKYWKYSKPFPDSVALSGIFVNPDNKIWILGNYPKSKSCALYLSTDSAKSFTGLRTFKTNISGIRNFASDLYFLSDSLYKYNITGQFTSFDLPVAATMTDIFFLNKDTLWLTGYTVKPGFIIEAFIYTSADGGSNWTKTSYTNDKVVNGIYFINKDSGFIIGTGGYMAKSADGGNAWETVSLSTTQTLNKIYFTTHDKGIIIGGNGSIYRTTDAGGTWNVETKTCSNNLLSACFMGDSIAWLTGDNALIMKSGGYDPIIIPPGNIKNILDNNGIALYPNPTDGKLYFNNEKNSNISITIYDLKGMQVQSTIVNTNTIDISALPEGVYLIKIINEGAATIKKIIKK